MGLKLYNTLTRTKEDFVPIDPAHVRMYVCGPTVYDFAHIGNARPVIVFDVLFRLLQHVYGKDHVKYVRNITDVDDKINQRAARDFPDLAPEQAIRHVTETTNAQFQKDVAALGCLEPTHQPRATETIAEMIEIIQRLIAGGFAYAAEGHALFHVPAMADYGRLARRSLDDMIAGARVDVAPYKRDPMDFVLWKPSGPNEPGWDSPWGRGRPGWHIECSAMAWAHLGERFDIHGGGIDLVFPHHENEVAQTRCAFGHDVMANVWMHNGFLQVEGEKMSKSLGNFLTIREILDQPVGDAAYFGATVRLTMLKTHYRQPINWTTRSLIESATELEDWSRLMANVTPGAPDPQFVAALSDDLNTSNAITRLRALAKAAGASHGEPHDAAAALAGSLKLLGFDDFVALATAGAAAHDARLDNDIDAAFRATVEQRIAERLEARRGKDFKRSDEIRDELAALGVVLKDGKDPATGAPVTTWEHKR